MAHITLNTDEPGIRGLMRFRPETAVALNGLAEILLRGDNTLSRGERELIAAYVSTLNDCNFCASSHAAFASLQLDGGLPLVDQVRADMESAPISGKLKGLLRIAASVQKGGQHVREEQVKEARELGATDTEIHDTVLIAAAFCMFNRYVDGLGTDSPTDPLAYLPGAEAIVAHGYVGALGTTAEVPNNRNDAN